MLLPIGIRILIISGFALIAGAEEDPLFSEGIPEDSHADGFPVKAVPSVSARCNNGVVNSNGDWYYDAVTDTCFFYSTITATWPAAEQHCVFMGAHLATIEPQNQQFVQSIIQGGTPGRKLAWIGLRLSNLQTNTHSWVDGNLANLFRPWDTNEPSAQGTEGCVVMNSDNGKFCDFRCQWANGNRFVCRETKPNDNPPMPTTADVQEHWGCPISDRPGLLRFGSSCYWFSPPSDLKNWGDALKACQNLYHHPTDTSKSSSLVSIHNAMENEFLLAHMSGRLNRWTGLYEELDGKTLYWTDHTFVHFLNWHYPEPRPEGAECIMMFGNPARAGLWNDENCGSQTGYICKMQKDPSGIVPTSPPNLCPTNFHPHIIPGVEGPPVCFGVVSMSGFNSPQQACSSVRSGVRPATIVTPVENAFIHLMSNKLNNYAPSNATAWLGGKFSGRGSLTWDSGCYAKYNNLAHFYAQRPEEEACLIMHYNGKWSTVSCTQQLDKVEYAVCEERVVANECEKTEPSDAEGVCPMGFPKDCGDFCYRMTGHTSTSQAMIDSQATWEEAKTRCANMGSSLVTIRSEKDQRCVRTLMAEAEHSVWIGLYYQDNIVTPPTPPSGRWKWLDPAISESTLTFVNWAQGEPNFMEPSLGASRELCAEMGVGGFNPDDDGLWNNRHCTNGGRRGFICERLKSPLNNATCGFSNTGDWFYDARTDSCFFVSRTLASWPNAERACNSMDAHLATIEEDNHEFVRQSLARDYPIDTYFWIGLRLQHVQTMTHTWVDGNVANTFRAWDNNEPSPQGAEGCVVMNNKNGKWHDYRCQWADGYRFLCRKAKTPVEPVIPPVVQEHWGCPDVCKEKGCLRYGSSCYWISPTNEQKNWNDAHRACQQLYAHPTDITKSSDLVSIHNDLENDFLMAHLGADRVNRWTGLHEEIDRSTLYWTDQSYMEFTNWDYREPNSHSSQECVLMYGYAAKAGWWNDENCGSTAGYICKMQKDAAAPTHVPSNNNCPSGFHRLNGVCFGIVPHGTDPVTVCSQHGGAKFATILSTYENAFLRVLLNNAANENNITGEDPVQAWLGGGETGGKLTWNGGCFPKVNNIVNFYTNDQQTNCIALNRDGKWSTHECRDTVQFAACEIRDVECEKHEPTNTGVCPAGFPDEGNDFCYRVVHTAATASAECTKVTWTEAKAICARAGGSVLTIRTEADQRLIEKYLERTASSLWLGLYEEVDPLTNIGTWKWLDNNATYQGSFQNWEDGEPNVLTAGYTRESCVEIKTNGKWNNMQCAQGATRGYICEKARVPATFTPATTGAPLSGKGLDGLDGGAIAGIVISVLLLVPAVAYAVYWGIKKRNGGVFPGASLPYTRDNPSTDKTSVINDNDDSYT
ncbi:Macrophage mannose receptor 1 [Hypsibius exemplaris]|uniref:Macrophage mannose receptor 1 n=1 Tax=Hypsibius exemplaris TaxID=2072580 RepID=A0A9X6NGE0_HYPEX|nr:Macrophage mannose receptor 1 [Hypsibius exemplaris]